uniref:Uncharacterized protein n=1 Tax=Molossus molossus TaxID=27622 RepID=A0A7J8FRM9_MOLMO|nr:hypothetical protein HJG59_008311 [Molossus molossus]
MSERRERGRRGKETFTICSPCRSSVPESPAVKDEGRWPRQRLQASTACSGSSAMGCAGALKTRSQDADMTPRHPIISENNPEQDQGQARDDMAASQVSS